MVFSFCVRQLNIHLHRLHVKSAYFTLAITSGRCNEAEKTCEENLQIKYTYIELVRWRNATTGQKYWWTIIGPENYSDKTYWSWKHGRITCKLKSQLGRWRISATISQKYWRIIEPEHWIIQTKIYTTVLYGIVEVSIESLHIWWAVTLPCNPWSHSTHLIN